MSAEELAMRTKPKVTSDTMALKKTVYMGTFIHCTALDKIEVLENAAVGVNEKGIIEFVEREIGFDDGGKLRGRPDWDVVSVIDWRGESCKFFFPGFVDTHIHASQFPNVGIFGKTTLMDWLEKYTFPTEASIADPARARTIYTHCVRRTLAHGTTTASYFATNNVNSTNLLADICLSLGQRAFVGRVCMDSHLQPDYYNDKSAEASVEASRQCIDHIQKLDPENKLITPIITPRFAPSCTGPLQEGLGKLQAETKMPVQTHISENKREIALVKEEFGKHGDYAHVYDAHGLLGPQTILAHAIHLTPSEIELIKLRKAKISHCPVSNTSLASGLAPVRELLDAGIDVSLGTDVSGGYSPSILEAAKNASGVSRLKAHLADDKGASQEDSDRLKLSVEECLYLATRGGARCVNLGDKIGGFEVGKYWDTQLVDLGPKVEGKQGEGGLGDVALWGHEGWEEIVAKWMFCGDDRNTRAVWVAGRLLIGKP